MVSYRLRVRVSVPKYAPRQLPAADPAPPPAPARKGTRQVYFDARQAIATMIYDRELLPVGAMFGGPAIVEQFDATSVVPPAWRASVDRYRNLILERKG